MYYVINKGLTDTFANKNSMSVEKLEAMTGAIVEKSNRIGLVVKAKGKVIGRAFETKFEQMAYSEGL
jgi:hypothetical protein